MEASFLDLKTKISIIYKIQNKINNKIMNLIYGIAKHSNQFKIAAIFNKNFIQTSGFTI
jgi:hypothetical protein